MRVAVPAPALDLTTTDVFTYHYPTYAAAAAWYRDGRLPLWNPYLLCGIPWAATLQGGFFYPPHLLYLILPTSAALAASAVLHLVFAALATAAFARRAGLTQASALVAGILFVARGVLPKWLTHPPMLEAAAWFPFGALAIFDLVRGARTAAVARLALAFGGSLLAGYPQATLYCVYGWATLVPALLVSSKLPPRRWPARGGVVAGGLALGALVAAIQLVPALEVAREGTRALAPLTLDEAYAGMGGQGVSVLQRVLPGVRSSAGVVAVLTLPFALWSRRHRALAIWATAVGSIAFVASLGPVTPVFGWVWGLPGVALFRLPDRLQLLTAFCLALVVAIGLDELARWVAASPRSSRRIVALVPPLLACVAVVATGSRIDAAVALALAAAAAVVLFVFRSPEGLTAALAAIAVAELFVSPRPLILLPYGPHTEEVAGRYAAAFEALAERARPDRVWLYSALPPVEFASTWASRYGLRAMDGHEPMTMRRQAEYFSYFTEGTVSRTRAPLIFEGQALPLAPRPGRPPPSARRRLVDLAAVRYLVLRRAEVGQAGVQSLLGDGGLRAVDSPSEDLAVFENPNALPRAYVVHRVRQAPDVEPLLERLSAPGFDPRVESYVEGDVGFEPSETPGGTVAFVRDDERVVELDATLAAPGLVVLADSFAPGWHATVDGDPAAILATNHLFRGVVAAAGRRRVRFEYRPRGFTMGAVTSVLASILVLVLLAIGRPRESSASAERDG